MNSCEIILPLIWHVLNIWVFFCKNTKSRNYMYSVIGGSGWGGAKEAIVPPKIVKKKMGEKWKGTRKEKREERREGSVIAIVIIYDVYALVSLVFPSYFTVLLKFWLLGRPHFWIRLWLFTFTRFSGTCFIVVMNHKKAWDVLVFPEHIWQVVGMWTSLSPVRKFETNYWCKIEQEFVLSELLFSFYVECK